MAKCPVAKSVQVMGGFCFFLPFRLLLDVLGQKFTWIDLFLKNNSFLLEVLHMSTFPLH